MINFLLKRGLDVINFLLKWGWVALVFGILNGIFGIFIGVYGLIHHPSYFGVAWTGLDIALIVYQSDVLLILWRKRYETIVLDHGIVSVGKNTTHLSNLEQWCVDNKIKYQIFYDYEIKNQFVVIVKNWFHYKKKFTLLRLKL